MTARQITGFAAGLFLLAAGCRHARTIDAWPVLQREPQQGETDPPRRPGSRTEVLWPFGDVQHGKDYDQYAVRPLFNYRIEPGERVTEWQGLWPILLVRSMPDDRRVRIIPIYWGNSKTGTDGTDRNWMLFPVLFGGSDPKTGAYFAVFPLGGKLKGLLGRSEIRFLAFPLYSDSKMDNGRRAWNVLFPLIAKTASPYSRSSRVLPFFMRYKVKGEPAGYSVLWPFVHFSGRPAEGETRRSRFMLWPLFGWDNTPDARSFTMLWPFFSFGRRGDESWEYIAPWPFFRRTHKPKLDRVQFWPFYGRVTRPNIKRSYIAWPFYGHSIVDGKLERCEETRSWPFYRDTIKHEKDTSVKDRSTILWPLFQYHGRNDGENGSSGGFSTLSLLWFRDPDGFDRNWSVFWKLFEYTWEAGGRRSTRFIWRLYRHDRGPDGRRVQLGPLASYRRDSDGRRLSLLMGLFEYGSMHGRRHVRLLYLPLTR